MALEEHAAAVRGSDSDDLDWIDLVLGCVATGSRSDDAVRAAVRYMRRAAKQSGEPRRTRSRLAAAMRAVPDWLQQAAESSNWQRGRKAPWPDPALRPLARELRSAEPLPLRLLYDGDVAGELRDGRVVCAPKQARPTYSYLGEALLVGLVPVLLLTAGDDVRAVLRILLRAGGGGRAERGTALLDHTHRELGGGGGWEPLERRRGWPQPSHLVLLNWWGRRNAVLRRCMERLAPDTWPLARPAGAAALHAVGRPSEMLLALQAQRAIESCDAVLASPQRPLLRATKLQPARLAELREGGRYTDRAWRSAMRGTGNAADDDRVLAECLRVYGRPDAAAGEKSVLFRLHRAEAHRVGMYCFFAEDEQEVAVRPGVWKVLDSAEVDGVAQFIIAVDPAVLISQPTQ